MWRFDEADEFEFESIIDWGNGIIFWRNTEVIQWNGKNKNDTFL